MARIIPTAHWNDKKKYWKCAVQRDRVRRSFYSSLEGRKGKREAEAKAAEWLEFSTGADVRVEAAVTAYLTFRRRQSAYMVAHSEEPFFHKHVVPALGKRRLSQVTPLDWQQLILTLAEEGQCQSTIRVRIGCIRRFAQYCQDARLPLQKPTHLDVPAMAPESKRRSTLQPKHLKTLFQVDTTRRYGETVPDWFIHAYRFCVILGLRRGELCALDWADLEGDVLHVRHSIRQDGTITQGKTAAAQRDIVLPKLAQEELKQQRQQQDASKFPSAHIFPDELGRRCKPQSLLIRWKAYAAANGLPPLCFHELRHTAISAYKADVPAELLKQVVGHTASMDTFGHYGHALEGEASRAASLMDATFTSLLTD